MCRYRKKMDKDLAPMEEDSAGQGPGVGWEPGGRELWRGKRNICNNLNDK